jgi:hypothetical protein
MRSKHILNIGYPKCGTSWCWHVLAQQPWFSAPREKENLDLMKGIGVDQYFDSFKDYDITANFTPSNFALDRFIIEQLSEHPTVAASIMLRNPFEIYWSMYNFAQHTFSSYNAYVDNLVMQGWFNQTAVIINRWKYYFGPRLQIFMYEDIKQDTGKFFIDYCQRMQLPKPVSLDASLINVTKYGRRPNEDLHVTLVQVINQEIDKLQVVIQQDLSRWKYVS